MKQESFMLQGAFVRNLGKTLFVLICVIPTLLSAIYFFVFAHGEYVTKVEFGIRPAQMGSQKSDVGGVAGSLPFPAEVGLTSYGLVQYIESKKFLDDFQASKKLTDYYGWKKGDFLDFLSADSDEDDQLNFWRRKVHPYFDITTGLVSVEVRAFTADDSYHLSRQVLGMSESLINEISDKIRRDAVVGAESDVEDIGARLEQKRADLVTKRAEYGILDQPTVAAGNLQFINKLRDDYISLQAQKSTLSSDLKPDSPLVATIDKKMQLIQGELNQLTNSSGLGKSASVYAPRMREVEELKADIGILEKQYAGALEVLQKERALANRQSLYLIRFVDAVKPQIASEPHRMKMVALTFLLSLVIWAILCLTIRAVRDHLM
ncbi:hypothetical protein P5W99_03355 [Paraburkholderia sp. A3BS-1L]|uniref:hypothetical protein n=1 Tax=Paraburkholderia sp. A3BS-1L TaxID=3028375 RepID=UPI003DA9FDB8